MGMPRLSIYVADELYEAVRSHGIAVSAVAQAALQAEVARRANDAWVDRARRHPVRESPIDTTGVMTEVRDEFGA